MSTNTDKPQLTIAKPRDRSLEAFKEWILGILHHLKPDAESTMSEEKWAQQHQEFWEKVDRLQGGQQ